MDLLFIPNYQNMVETCRPQDKTNLAGAKKPRLFVAGRV